MVLIVIRSFIESSDHVTVFGTKGAKAERRQNCFAKYPTFGGL
jgi:hypothetical protein